MRSKDTINLNDVTPERKSVSVIRKNPATKPMLETMETILKPSTPKIQKPLAAQTVQTSKPPATKITTPKPPATKITTPKPPATKITTSKPPATKITTSKPPATKITTPKPPATKITTSKSPATKITTSKPPAIKITPERVVKPKSKPVTSYYEVPMELVPEYTTEENKQIARSQSNLERQTINRYAKSPVTAPVSNKKIYKNPINTEPTAFPFFHENAAAKRLSLHASQLPFQAETPYYVELIHQFHCIERNKNSLKEIYEEMRYEKMEKLRLAIISIGYKCIVTTIKYTNIGTNYALLNFIACEDKEYRKKILEQKNSDEALDFDPLFIAAFKEDPLNGLTTLLACIVPTQRTVLLKNLKKNFPYVSLPPNIHLTLKPTEAEHELRMNNMKKFIQNAVSLFNVRIKLIHEFHCIEKNIKNLKQIYEEMGYEKIENLRLAIISMGYKCIIATIKHTNIGTNYALLNFIACKDKEYRKKILEQKNSDEALDFDPLFITAFKDNALNGLTKLVECIVLTQRTLLLKNLKKNFPYVSLPLNIDLIPEPREDECDFRITYMEEFMEYAANPAPSKIKPAKRKLSITTTEKDDRMGSKKRIIPGSTGNPEAIHISQENNCADSEPAFNLSIYEDAEYSTIDMPQPFFPETTNRAVPEISRFGLFPPYNVADEVSFFDSDEDTDETPIFRAINKDSFGW